MNCSIIRGCDVFLLVKNFSVSPSAASSVHQDATSFPSRLRFAVEALDERRPVISPSPMLMRNLFHSIYLRPTGDELLRKTASPARSWRRKAAASPHYCFAICGRQITRKPKESRLDIHEGLWERGRPDRTTFLHEFIRLRLSHASISEEIRGSGASFSWLSRASRTKNRIYLFRNEYRALYFFQDVFTYPR